MCASVHACVCVYVHVCVRACVCVCKDEDVYMFWSPCSIMPQCLSEFIVAGQVSLMPQSKVSF